MDPNITVISSGLYMVNRPRSIPLLKLRTAVENALPKGWRVRLIALKGSDPYGVCFHKEF